MRELLFKQVNTTAILILLIFIESFAEMKKENLCGSQFDSSMVCLDIVSSCAMGISI